MIVVVLPGFAKTWRVAKESVGAAIARHLGQPEPTAYENQFGDLRIALMGAEAPAVGEAAHLYLDYAHIPYRIEETR